jgi:hypothetical protein
VGAARSSERHNWHVDFSRKSRSKLRHSNGTRARSAAVIRPHYWQSRHGVVYGSTERGGSWKIAGVEGPFNILGVNVALT